MRIRDAILQDAQKRLDNLIQFSASRREWYANQILRIGDRQSTQISLISSVSATILAITTALPAQKVSAFTAWSFISLLLATISGIFLILLTINFDQTDLEESRKEEIGIFDKLKTSTKNLLSNPTENERLKHIEVFKNEVDRISNIPEKYQTRKFFLNCLYWIVLGSFILGVVFLTLAWFTGSTANTSQFLPRRFERHFYK
jgi:hypothetical protein